MPPPLLLASRSPRRRELLAARGFPFEVVDVEVDETPPSGVAPIEVARVLAARKARAAAEEHGAREGLFLTADTLVVDGMELLGKPVDHEDARRMLRALSGREHEVITGFALFAPGTDVEPVAEAVVTRVRFRELEDAQITAYLATGEADDKAGAYGIQGAAGAFVASTEGSYTNVVGLPMEAVVAALATRGVTPDG